MLCVSGDLRILIVQTWNVKVWHFCVLIAIHRGIRIAIPLSFFSHPQHAVLLPYGLTLFMIHLICYLLDLMNYQLWLWNRLTRWTWLPHITFRWSSPVLIFLRNMEHRRNHVMLLSLTHGIPLLLWFWLLSWEMIVLASLIISCHSGHMQHIFFCVDPSP